jgi:hypothetical protein
MYKLSALNYCSIAKAGGNLIVKSKGLSSKILEDIAAACKASNSTLTIIDYGLLSAIECVNIAKKNPGKVTFNFCE